MMPDKTRGETLERIKARALEAGGPLLEALEAAAREIMQPLAWDIVNATDADLVLFYLPELDVMEACFELREDTAARLAEGEALDAEGMNNAAFAAMILEIRRLVSDECGRRNKKRMADHWARAVADN